MRRSTKKMNIIKETVHSGNLMISITEQNDEEASCIYVSHSCLIFIFFNLSIFSSSSARSQVPTRATMKYRTLRPTRTSSPTRASRTLFSTSSPHTARVRPRPSGKTSKASKYPSRRKYVSTTSSGAHGSSNVIFKL